MTINNILNTLPISPRLLLAVYSGGKILYIGSDRKMPEEIAECKVKSFIINKISDNSKIARMQFYVFW